MRIPLNWPPQSAQTVASSGVLTGNPTDSCGSGVEVIAPGDFTGNFVDQTNGYTFQASGGWDYDTEQFQYVRSEALVW